jgi:hypothetical protein
MTRGDYEYRNEPVGNTGNTPVQMRATAITPIDRVRWPAVFAGIFAAISLLVVLAVLGAAVGFSAYDRGDNPRNYLLGAGWWAAISALIAFALGGWFAARTSAARGGSNGMINGAMVWAVAVPLSIALFTGGLASLGSTAANTVSNAQRDSMTSSQGGQGNIADQARQAGAQLQGQMTPENMERASDTGAKTAWSTFASLVLGFLAASIGGYLGARRDTVETYPTGNTATAG